MTGVVGHLGAPSGRGAAATAVAVRASRGQCVRVASSSSVALADWDAVVCAGDGSLPNGQAFDTDVRQWQTLLDEIVRKGWPMTFARDGDSVPVPSAEDAFALSARASVSFTVWPAPGVQVNIFPLESRSIDFDFDLRELSTQPALDGLCGFVRVVGTAARRDVFLTAEGDDDARFCVYRHSAGLFELLSPQTQQHCR